MAGAFVGGQEIAVPVHQAVAAALAAVARAHASIARGRALPADEAVALAAG